MFEVIDLLQAVLILWSFSTNFLITLHHAHMSFIYKFLDCLSYMFYWVHSIQKHLMNESVEHCIFFIIESLWYEKQLWDGKDIVTGSFLISYRPLFLFVLLCIKKEDNKTWKKDWVMMSLMCRDCTRCSVEEGGGVEIR